MKQYVSHIWKEIYGLEMILQNKGRFICQPEALWIEESEDLAEQGFGEINCLPYLDSGLDM